MGDKPHVIVALSTAFGANGARGCSRHPHRLAHSWNLRDMHRYSSFEDDALLAFQMVPIGLLVSRNRVIRSYNQAFCSMFGYDEQGLRGMSLERLYPSAGEFKNIGERALVAMRGHGTYSDERIMRTGQGQLFWCHVTGRALRRDEPFAVAVWAFEDLSAVRKVTTNLTQREREVAQFLVHGLSSKQIAQKLEIGHRTVEAHRARLMLKFKVATTGELLVKLVGGH